MQHNWMARRRLRLAGGIHGERQKDERPENERQKGASIDHMARDGSISTGSMPEGELPREIPPPVEVRLRRDDAYMNGSCRNSYSPPASFLVMISSR